MKTKLLILTILFSLGHSTILNVPENYSTIQSGIDAAVDGDTVLVEPGTYFENINFNEKSIVLSSYYIFDEDPLIIEVTVIDGNDAGTVVIFNNNVGSELNGFTIKNGIGSINSSSSSGGIFIDNYSNPRLDNLILGGNHQNYGRGAGIGITNDSHPYLNNIIVENNYGVGIYCRDGGDAILKQVIITNNSGSGIFCYRSNPIISNIQINGNESDYGGGIQLISSNPIIMNSIIKENTAEFGGGLDIRNDSNPILFNVNISNNTAENGGGGIYCIVSNPIFSNILINNNIAAGGSGIVNVACDINLTNSTIFGNISSGQSGSLNFYNSSSTITNSIIWANSPNAFTLDNSEVDISFSNIQETWEGEGNISGDPNFANSDLGDFTLQTGSPCIDAGNPNPIYNEPDLSIADMGATGGGSILPSFFSFGFEATGTEQFGEVRSVDWYFYNFRETPFVINNAEFDSFDFEIENINFPYIIEPLSFLKINISFNPSNPDLINSTLVLESNDFYGYDNYEIYFTGIGVSESTISGNLSGLLELDYSPYLIVGDVFIEEQDSLIISPGVIIYFYDDFDITSNGILRAIGTVSDSIYFTSYYPDEKRGGEIELKNYSEMKFVVIENNNAYSTLTIFSNYPTISDVTIRNNNNYGLWINSRSGSVGDPFKKLIITNNNTGVKVNDSNPVFENVLIANNSSEGLLTVDAGFSCEFGNPVLKNVTIVNNIADNWGTGGIHSASCHPHVINSIVWGNSPENIEVSPAFENMYSTISVEYSDIEGGLEDIEVYNGDVNWLIGNINNDPLFTDPENGDFTLQENSPCIDAGDPNSPLDPDGTIVDMGAFYFDQSQGILGDVNEDGEINILDVVMTVNMVLTGEFNDLADLNSDGNLNVLDIVIIVNIILR